MFDPPASVAVTVMVVRPALPGVIVSIESDRLSVATDVLDEVAAYVSASSSGSRKAPATSTTSAVAPTSSARSATIPTATGGWFPTPAVTDTGALRTASPPSTTTATQYV